MTFNENKLYPTNIKIDTTINYYPVIHYVGDTISERWNWNPGEYKLEYNYHTEGSVNTNISIGTWRDVDKKFIGIRISEKENKYYGWIELGLSCYRISLCKYAYGLIK